MFWLIKGRCYSHTTGGLWAIWNPERYNPPRRLVETVVFRASLCGRHTFHQSKLDCSIRQCMQVLWIRNQIESHAALYHITLYFIILYHTSCQIIVTTLYYVALNCIRAPFSHRPLFVSGYRWSGHIVSSSRHQEK